MKSAVPIQRGRRGSDVASAWARNLRLRLAIEDPDGRRRYIPTGVPPQPTKFLLLTLGQYVDADGMCYPSIQTLSDDTEMSWETVKRRLADLEFLGLIVRKRRWRDDNGAVNYEGRGRETSGEIILRFEVTQEQIDARLVERKKAGPGELEAEEIEPEAAPEEAAQGAQDEHPSDGAPEGEGAQDEHPEKAEEVPANPSLVSTPGAHSGAPMNRLLEPLNPPIAPLPSDSVQPDRPAAADEDKRLEQRNRDKEVFRQTYPLPTNRPEQLDALFDALTDAQVAIVLKGARGAKSIREREPKRSLVDPANFLKRSALWVEYGRFAPRVADPLPPPVFAALGSDEWRARAVKAAILGRSMPHPKRIAERNELGGLFLHPLEPGVIALANYADENGLVDKSRWLTVNRDGDQSDKKNPQFVAWGNRIKEWGGSFPEGELVLDCVQGERTRMCETCTCGTERSVNGKPMRFPARRYVLRVPQEWPPSKGAHAPPASELMTEEDAEELARG